MLKAEIKKAKNDASLASKIDTDVLLEELTKNKHNHLEDKTNADIINEMRDVLEFYELDVDTYLPRLIGYRFAGDLVDLVPGQHVRWIRDQTLTNGGIYLGSSFTNTGTVLKIKLYAGRIVSVSMQNCIVFQKLSFGESVVLYASDIINS